MKRFLISSTIALTLLTACRSVQTFPITTPTATATTVPTSTMIPTLEPWMMSLPDDVVSVQMEGDEIFGVDAQGNQIEKFNIDSSQWETYITDIPAWLDERTQYWIEQGSYSSWQELVETKVMKQYRQEINTFGYWDKFVYGTSTFQAYVFEVVEMPDGTMQAVVAVPFSTQAGLVELGIITTSGYVPMVTHFHEPRHGFDAYDPKIKLDTPESLNQIEGKMMVFSMASQAASGNIVEERLEFFLSGSNKNAKYMYRDLVLLRTEDQRDLFLQIALDPNNSPNLNNSITQEMYNELKTNHPKLLSTYGMAARAILVMDVISKSDPYIIADRVMPYSPSLTEEDLFRY